MQSLYLSSLISVSLLCVCVGGDAGGEFLQNVESFFLFFSPLSLMGRDGIVPKKIVVNVNVACENVIEIQNIRNGLDLI